MIQLLEEDIELKISSPCDLWALGASISFYCNREHPFKNLAKIAHWKGGTGIFEEETKEKYGEALQQLVGVLLNPIPDYRPKAKDVVSKSQIYVEKFCKY